MSCEHEVRFTIKPTDDACRFHFDVRAYKDRIVAPDEYSGATEVTPSHIEQVLPTTDKLVRDDITVLPAPTEYLSTDHNGTFTPSDGKVGFSQVDVNVNPDLRPLSVSENGQYSPDGFDGYSSVTADIEPNLTSLAVTENGLYLPESGVDGFDRVNVDVPVPSGSTTITENGTYDVEQYASAVVDVLQKITADGIADNSQEYGDMVLTVPKIRGRAFSGALIDSVTALNCTEVEQYAFAGCLTITQIDFPALKTVGIYGFNTIGIASAVLPSLITANVGMFANSPNLKDIRIGEDIQTIGDNFVANSQVGWSVKIKGTPTSIHAGAFRFSREGDMYVPWSEGEVANAPWSARNATIHYDTVYDEEWNVISST